MSWDLIEQAARQPAAPAFLLEDRELSYAALDARVWQCARVLAAAGAQPGRIVGLALRSELPFALALLACTRLGAPFTVLSTAQSDRERLPVDLLVLDPGARSADPALRSIVLDLSALDAQPATPDPGLMSAHPDAPWQFLTGSGSTGTPKVMPISHRVQNARAVAARSVRNLRPADRFLCLPAMDTHFCRTQMFYALHAGAAFVLRDRSSLKPLPLCRQYGITILDAASIHLEGMLASVPVGSEAAARRALRTVRMLMVTSSAVSDDRRRRVRDRLTDRLVVLYSTNESSPISMAGGSALWSVPGTVGRVLQGVEVRILGPDDRPVPVGEVGVLEVRSPGVIAGYHDDPAATRKAFRGGWFRTGDLVRALPDGQLVYCGREDHMMIMNGVNIHPAEIERTLCEHPAVADAAAVPLRHPVHQEVPVCAVVLRPGIPVTDRELLAFAERRLGFRGPRGIVVLDEIPRNAQGKLQRDRIIEAVASRANMTGCA